MKRLPFAGFPKLFIALALLPVTASAHPGHDGGHGFGWDFSGGFMHPVLGLDHLLAMVAVGLWASQLGGRLRWLAPTVFVSAMTLGAAMSIHGLSVPAVEQMIAASLLGFGLMISMARRMPIFVGLGLTAVFAIFHGLAHGAEISEGASGLAYGSGFVLATVLLHAGGLGLGRVGLMHSSRVAKATGVGIGITGAVLLLV